MNVSRLTWNTLPPGNGEIHENEANDWLGGEVRVTTQPFNIERFSVIDSGRGVDPANDWIPL